MTRLLRSALQNRRFKSLTSFCFYTLDTGLSTIVTQECLLPKPVDFWVEYEEGVSITLSWRASDLPENRSQCRGSDVFEVRSRWYANLEDYNEFFRVQGVLDFQLVQGTNYTLDFRQHNVDSLSYFAFDVRNEGDLNLAPGRTRRQDVPTPVYYFEMQGMKMICGGDGKFEFSVVIL